VTEKLDQRSQEALMHQHDPAQMTDSEVYKIRKAINNRVYAYINEALRGTRDPVLEEGRAVATILRREYPKMYALPPDKTPMDDRLHHKVVGGVRYERTRGLQKKIRDGIALKREANKDKDEATTAVKRAKATYLVDSKKFGATATEAQLAQELTPADLGTEETHKILQCRIR
jgi:hypothetical protein